MIELCSYKDSCSKELYSMVQRFVADKFLEALDIELDILAGVDDKDFYNHFLPESFVATHQIEECYYRIKSVRGRIDSTIEYSSFPPLLRYILYNIWNCRLDDYFFMDSPELGACVVDGNVKFILPEEIRKGFVQEFKIEKNSTSDIESDDYNEGLMLLENLEDANGYMYFFTEDEDFLEEDLRSIVELAVTNNPIFENIMTYEELDEFIDLMPLDIVDAYKKFRENQGNNSEEANNETVVIDSILNALTSLTKRILDHKDKGEVELTADLQGRIEQFLLSKNIRIAREYTLGRAKKGIGETDLYFSTFENGRMVDIAVLENKYIEKFEKQYFQLMGYLNPNFLYGITLSINKNMKLKVAQTYIMDKLKQIKGDFTPVAIYEGKDNLPLVLSVHKIPETGNEMKVYHLILNLYDEERAEAAIIARR